jgi:hypothetical protein
MACINVSCAYGDVLDDVTCMEFNYCALGYCVN